MKTTNKIQKYSLLIIALVMLSIIFTGCKKPVPGCSDPEATNYKASATEPDPKNPCTYKGTIMFWQNADNGQVLIDVGKQSGGITMYYPGIEPSGCAAKGCATFILATGTYSYLAFGKGNNKTWTGSVTVGSKDCKSILLK